MEIIKELRIREKFTKGFLRGNNVYEIIIHGTGGGSTAEGMFNWMLTGERQERYKQGIGLFHYLIDRQGKIYEIISPEMWVYHSGTGKHDSETIGIELINTSSKNLDEFTSKQYESLDFLIDYLLQYYYIEIIEGHGQCQKRLTGIYKQCPGNFDWNAITPIGFEIKNESLIKIR